MPDPTTIYSIPSGDLDAEPALTLGTALPKQRNGIDCYYYWRKVAKDGAWFNPVGQKDAAGNASPVTMHVTPEDRQTWEQNFHKMSQVGEEPPVVKDHREDDADATLGYVKAVRQNGPWYEELHQYLGPAARDVALRNKLSVGLNPNYVDPLKRRLGPTIVHTAVTSRPGIPNDGQAVQVASRNNATYEIITLSKAADDSAPDPKPAGSSASDDPAGAPQRRHDMCKLNASKETLDALHKHVPGLADAADDDKLARVAQHLQTMSDADAIDSGQDGKLNMSAAEIHDKAVANRKVWKEAAGKVPGLEAKLAEKDAKLTEAAGQIQTMSRAGAQPPPPPEPDPLAMKLMSRSLDIELDAAVAAGGVDPNTAKQFKDMLVKGGKPTLLAMSRTGDEDPHAFQVVALLKQNKPRVQNGQTGVQTMSRADPDSHDPSSEAEAMVDRMIAKANNK